MLTLEETQKIASKVLSSKEIHRSITMVPHEQGEYSEAGQSYTWRSFHLPQCGLFLLTRRSGKDGPLEFAHFTDVSALTRAASELRQEPRPPIKWQSLA